ESPSDDVTEEYPSDDVNFSSVQAPEAIHDETDIYINKDNIVPILKTLALAYTRKEAPTYKDILKAGSMSGFKTAFKYLGKPSLGSTLLKAIRSYTHYLDDDEIEDEETSALGELAEKYLSSHKFKIMFPESLLLHEEDMLQFAMKRKAEEVLTGRSSLSSERDMLVPMPRADPAVHTVLSISPLTWLAVLGGLFSIPYFFTDDTDIAAARDDRPFINRPGPSVWLQPPPHNSRTGEEEFHPHQSIDETEYEAYLREYDEWYKTWYQVYQKHTLHQNPPALQQASPVAQHPVRQHRPVAHQAPRQPRPVTRQPIRQTRPVVQHPPRQPPAPVHKVPQAHRKNQQHHNPPQQLVAAARPVQAIAAPAPRLTPPQGASLPIINSPADPTTNNNFGTFQTSSRNSDSHFKVLQDVPGETSSTAKTPVTTSTTPKTPITLTQSRPIQRPNPSPQPVFRHNTTPKTERGFVPIIKPQALQQASEDSRKSGFSDIKSTDILKTSNATKKAPASSNTKNKATSLKPELKPSLQVTNSGKSKKQEAETTTIRLSPITSGVFKTTRAPTPKPATTPPPGTRHAIFVKTSTDKSVRVVTSSSVVLPNGSQQVNTQDGSLPELERPQRLVQAKDAPALLQIDNSLKQPTIVHAVPVSQPLVQARPPPTVVKAQPVARPQSITPIQPNGGFVRTNIPTHIKVIDHNPETSTPVPITTTTLPPTTTMPIYALDPFYGPRLSRVDVIFHQLGLESEGCREQVVCNIYKNPDVYTPFSDYLSRQLTVKLEELQKPKVSDERILRFFRYLKAAREGQDGNECLSRYPSCPTDTTRLSHKPTFNAFHKVELLMNAGL
ncbi:unnamed protein product, partial [Meganyctiphanes norvegica]